MLDQVGEHTKGSARSLRRFSFFQSSRLVATKRNSPNASTASGEGIIWASSGLPPATFNDPNATLNDPRLYLNRSLPYALLHARAIAQQTDYEHILKQTDVPEQSDVCRATGDGSTGNARRVRGPGRTSTLCGRRIFRPWRTWRRSSCRY